MLPRFCPPSYARIQNFCQSGEGDLSQVIFILIYFSPQLLILQRRPNGLFQEKSLNLFFLYAGGGGPKVSEGPIVNSSGNL